MKEKKESMARIDPAVIRQFIKYGLVGVINTCLTLAVIFILTKVFRVSDYAANAVGYVVGFVNSFLWNKLWTFRSSGNFFRETGVFLLVFAFSYSIQFGVLYFLIDIMRWKDMTAHINMGFIGGWFHWKDNILSLPWSDFAQVLSMGVYTMLGFIGNKLFTFKKNK